MARPDMGVTLGAPGVWAQYLAGAEFAAPEPLTVEVTLARPMADLPDLLVQGFVAAPSVLDDPVARPCGTGAYIFESADATRITARANPDHWAGPPPNARVEWRRMEAAADRLAAFERGAAQVATRLPPEGPPPPDTIDHLAPVTLIYLMNAAEGPLADPRIRRALNLALDRDALVRDVLGGAGRPLHGPFSPAHRGHVPGASGPDAQAARALLAEAGHPDGLTLRVDTPTALPDEAERLTAAVAAQLAPLGVRFDIRVIEDRTEYAHMVRRSEVRDMCVFDSSPLSTYRVLREKVDGRVKGSWWLGYSNAHVEALIDRAATEPDHEARDAIFRAAHDLLVADPPWLFCYCHMRRTGIRGLQAGFAMRADAVLDVAALPEMGA
jgi:peptide/nickel transport system substrate-binding protein